jgi:hypothetical protein
MKRKVVKREEAELGPENRTLKKEVQIQAQPGCQGGGRRRSTEMYETLK